MPLPVKAIILNSFGCELVEYRNGRPDPWRRSGRGGDATLPSDTAWNQAGVVRHAYRFRERVQPGDAIHATPMLLIQVSYTGHARTQELIEPSLPGKPFMQVGLAHARRLLLFCFKPSGF